jgi:VWFA-related protein
MLELVLAASFAGGMPQERPPLEFGTDVRMIRLDVSVVNGRGHPVTGLSARDFQVFEDGRPVEIALFERIVEGEAQVESEPTDEVGVVVTPERHLERRILILVDTGAMSFGQLVRARDGASAFIRQSTRDGEWVRLVNLSTGQTWDGTMPHDRMALSSVARGLLPGGSPWGSPLSSGGGIVQVSEGRAGVSMDTTATETATSGQFLSVFAQATGLLGTLESLLVELDGVEGRKAIVLVSPGFPQLLDLDRQLQKVASLARLAATTIYFVDAMGLDGLLPEPGGRMMPAFEMAWNRSGGATDLAEATGGFTSRFSNTLLPALARVGNEMRSYYVVGYVPTKPDDGRFRSVKVKVKADGVTARTKKGYLAGRPRKLP